MITKKIATVALLCVALLGTSACSNMNTQAQRALSGGAIGAAGGAGIAYIAGGPVIGAALLGGAAGAAVGALTTQNGK
ncbi:conserved protein of unknown function [Magnetospirillum sp. XM-1]|uniref:hypothetical protein n=1 Tax=Magnetospirillum sp. XM-1 TaxID=1663591 RepID=UPI00073DBC76|nr:hypothetical protein [Magnetospirillum sp. XM-1]CUW37445.1 conserved protein of unknown function [Magnetospirillum sp. XM-1]